MSSPFTQARASLMSATAVFALAAALASCGWDTTESALHDTEASALQATHATRAAAHRFSDDFANALRLLADLVPEQAAATF